MGIKAQSTKLNAYKVAVQLPYRLFAAVQTESDF